MAAHYISRNRKGNHNLNPPFRTATPVSGTNYLELESECPQNGSAVLKGIKIVPVVKLAFRGIKGQICKNTHGIEIENVLGKVLSGGGLRQSEKKSAQKLSPRYGPWRGLIVVSYLPRRPRPGSIGLELIVLS